MYKIFMLLILLISSPASSGWFGFGNSINGAFGYELGETYHGPSYGLELLNPKKPLEGFSQYHIGAVNNKIYSISAVSSQSTLKKVLNALEKKYGKFKVEIGDRCGFAYICGDWTFQDGNRKIIIVSPYHDEFSYWLNYLDIDLSNVRRKQIGSHDKYIGSDSL